MRQVKMSVHYSLLEETYALMKFAGTRIVNNEPAADTAYSILTIEGDMFPNVPSPVEVIPSIERIHELDMVMLDWRYANIPKFSFSHQAFLNEIQTRKVKTSTIPVDYKEKYEKALVALRTISGRIIDYLGDPFPGMLAEAQVEFSEFADELQAIVNPILEAEDARTSERSS